MRQRDIRLILLDRFFPLHIPRGIGLKHFTKLLSWDSLWNMFGIGACYQQ